MFFTAQRIAMLCPRALASITEPASAALEASAPTYGVTALARRAALMGQLAVESAGFTKLEENLHYTHVNAIAGAWPRLAPCAPLLVDNPEGLANAAYAGKNGNGDEASGDGWRFRGRGLIQITGRANYAAASSAAGLDLVANPAAAADPAIAVRVALWFWQSHGCNELADAGAIDAITLKVNGPRMEQANIRRMLTDRAMTVFV